MKILIITDYFPTLSETFILNQITGLIDRGHEIVIFARDNRTAVKTHEEIKKYKLTKKCYFMPKSKMQLVGDCISKLITNIFKSPLKVIKVLKAIKYKKKIFPLIYYVFSDVPRDFDIIHCHYGTNGLLGVYLKEFGFKGKVVTTFHGYDIRLALKDGSRIYNDLLRAGDKFIAPSEYTKGIYKSWGVADSKIYRHPVGLDINKYHFRSAYYSKKQTNLKKIKIVIITVSRLVKEKGIAFAVEACSKLIKKGYDISYWIVGDGYERQNLELLTHELCIESFVTFYGACTQREVIKLLNKADIFLLASVEESFGLVLLEAQAVGLPIIATRVGGVAEAVIAHKSAYLVMPGSSNEIVKGMEALITNSGNWSDMAKCGREYIENNYKIKDLNDKLERMYKSLLC